MFEANHPTNLTPRIRLGPRVRMASAVASESSPESRGGTSSSRSSDEIGLQDSGAQPIKRQVVKDRRWTPIQTSSTAHGEVREFRFLLQEPYPEVVCEVGYDAPSSVADTGVMLARYLEKVPERVRGKTVLELGSGTGFVGLVASALGAARVTLTDLAAQTPLPRRNAQAFLERNSDRDVTVEALAWGGAPSGLYDIIIVSDCLLEDQERLFEPLCATLCKLLENGGKALFAYEQRTLDCQPFFDLLHDAEIIAVGSSASLECRARPPSHPTRVPRCSSRTRSCIRSTTRRRSSSTSSSRTDRRRRRRGPGPGASDAASAPPGCGAEGAPSWEGATAPSNRASRGRRVSSELEGARPRAPSRDAQEDVRRGLRSLVLHGGPGPRGRSRRGGPGGLPRPEGATVVLGGRGW